MKLLSVFPVGLVFIEVLLTVLCWELAVRRWLRGGSLDGIWNRRWLQWRGNGCRVRNVPKEELQESLVALLLARDTNPPSGKWEGADIWTPSWRIARISMGMGEGHGRKPWMSSSHQREAWDVSGGNRRSALSSESHPSRSQEMKLER